MELPVAGKPATAKGTCSGTPSRKVNQWLYWRNRFRTKSVDFDEAGRTKRPEISEDHLWQTVPRTDIAITGIVSYPGTWMGKVTESLQRGRSGINIDLKRQELGFRSAFSWWIDEFTAPPRTGGNAAQSQT